MLGITGAMTFYGMTAGLALGVFNAALAFTLQVSIVMIMMIRMTIGITVRIGMTIEVIRMIGGAVGRNKSKDGIERRIRMTIEVVIRIGIVVRATTAIRLIMVKGINNSNGSNHSDSKMD